MGNISDTSNSDSDDEDEESESDEGPSQPVEDVASNTATNQITHHLMVRDFGDNASSTYDILPSQYCGININIYSYWLMSLLMGLTIGHSLYWFILVLIGLTIYIIDIVRYPAWTYDNRFRVRLGNTQPWPSDFTVGLNQGGQGAARIAQPSDSLQPLTITWTFSTTIREYFPPLRASIVVQDSQPHTMPASIILNNIRPSRLVHNENNHPNTGETTQNIRDEIRTLPMHTEPIIQVIKVGNAAPEIPNEIPRDFEYSIPTNEHQNGNELAAHSVDEQRILRESLRHVRSSNDGELTRNIDHRNEALSNTEIITVVDQNNSSPNQTNVADEQIVATTLATDSSSSQIRETERSVDAPTEVGQQVEFTATDSVINNGPKQRTPSTSSNESAGEINT